MPKRKKPTEPVKLIIWVEADSEREVAIPAEDLDDRDESGRKRFFDEYARDESMNMIRYGWKLKE